MRIGRPEMSAPATRQVLHTAPLFASFHKDRYYEREQSVGRGLFTLTISNAYQFD